MPDLPIRLSRERELSAAVLLVLQAEQERLLRNPRGADWVAFQRRLAAAIVTDLAATHYAATVQLSQQAGLSFNAPRSEAESQQWAMRYADALATAIVGNTRAQVQELQDRDALAAALLLLMGEDRALGIGITETTRAITAGESGVVYRYERETGQQVGTLWKTEGDGKVCEICGPLEGQPVDVYRIVSPSGPPAHPRCRCWLEYEFGSIRRAA